VFLYTHTPLESGLLHNKYLDKPQRMDPKSGYPRTYIIVHYSELRTFRKNKVLKILGQCYKTKIDLECNTISLNHLCKVNHITHPTAMVSISCRIKDMAVVRSIVDKDGYGSGHTRLLRVGHNTADNIVNTKLRSVVH